MARPSPGRQADRIPAQSGRRAGAEGGVWVMQADGSERRQVGEYGAPFWSPDGREFLINGYSDSHRVHGDQPRDQGREASSRSPDIRSSRGRAGPGPGRWCRPSPPGSEGDSIALLDVRNPAEAKIIEVLWKRSDDLDVIPRWPRLPARSRRCFFVGVEPRNERCFSIQRGESGRVSDSRPGAMTTRHRKPVVLARRPISPVQRQSARPTVVRSFSGRVAGTGVGVPVATAGAITGYRSLCRSRKVGTNDGLGGFTGAMPSRTPWKSAS